MAASREWNCTIFCYPPRKGSIPDGFNVNKNPCIGKPSKKFVPDWKGQLNNVESKLYNLVLYKYVEKLFIWKFFDPGWLAAES